MMHFYYAEIFTKVPKEFTVAEVFKMFSHNDTKQNVQIRYLDCNGPLKNVDMMVH